jgi:fatty-acyl-CoA synthase
MSVTSPTSPLAARFSALAAAEPEQVLLRFRQGTQTLTLDARTFWLRCQALTTRFRALGVGLGDRVAWLGLNHPDQLAALVACARLGAMWLPLNFRLAVAELQQVLDDARPCVLVADASHASTAAALHCAGMARLNADALSDTLAEALGDADAAAVWSPDAAMGSNDAGGPDTPVLLVYTSGTTGRAKGAVHTQAAVLANAQASGEAHQYQRSDVVLSTLPLFHVGGLCIQTLPAMLAGVEVILHERFDAAAWLGDVQSLRPSLSLLVPATLRAVLEHSEWSTTDLSGLRGVMTGSSVVPLAYIQAFHRRGIPVGQIYGTTETGPVSVVLGLDQAMAHAGAAGWPHAQAQLRLTDAAGQPVAPGQTGEVQIKANNLMQGYWRLLHSPGLGLVNGWFATGDLGQLDAQGCLTIVGRSKDMIISGGENIYPAELENHVVALPGVAECAVVGTPDERWGEVPVLVVVRVANEVGATLGVDGLLAFLAARVARFKLPKRVVFLDALPKSALGKVLKPQLQRQVADQADASLSGVNTSASSGVQP